MQSNDGSHKQQIPSRRTVLYAHGQVQMSKGRLVGWLRFIIWARSAPPRFGVLGRGIIHEQCLSFGISEKSHHIFTADKGLRSHTVMFLVIQQRSNRSMNYDVQTLLSEEGGSEKQSVAVSKRSIPRLDSKRGHSVACVGH